MEITQTTQKSSSGNGLEISLDRKSLIETLVKRSVLSSEKFKGVKLKTNEENWRYLLIILTKNQQKNY
ncbi:MAG: hypothetical protein CM15mP22_5600 [Gammaproteobacteria bacterium]|nr:MAG: hypothetical protein CM15mP22_5600 [Gammaproteobacteria bacterium]